MPEETPKPELKVVVVGKEHLYGPDEKYCLWYNCPACGEHEIMRDYWFCPMCGVRVYYKDL